VFLHGPGLHEGLADFRLDFIAFSDETVVDSDAESLMQQVLHGQKLDLIEKLDGSGIIVVVEEGGEDGFRGGEVGFSQRSFSEKSVANEDGGFFWIYMVVVFVIEIVGKQKTEEQSSVEDGAHSYRRIRRGASAKNRLVSLDFFPEEVEWEGKDVGHLKELFA